MEKFLILTFDGLIFWITAYICGRILIKEEKLNRIKLILATIIFAIILGVLNSTNFEFLYGIFKINVSYMLMCIYYCIVFNQTITKNSISALAFYLCMFLSEIIVAISLSLLLPLFNQKVEILKDTILINLLVGAFATLIVLKLKKVLVKFIVNTEKGNKGSIIIIFVILLTLALLVFKIPVGGWYFNAEFIITMLILLCFCIVALYILKQRSDIGKTTLMYQKVVEYSKTTNKLLEDYRVANHEHKNQLSIIRQMTDKNNKKLVEYLDNLLDNKNISKYQWISSLNNLPSEGLKGLINYKLIEMENLGIKPIVSISKDISKIKLKELNTKQNDNLYSIAGVYLDNAIEASTKSKEKRINLDIHKEKKDLVIVIANTYKGKIDLNKMDEYGYSTKGKNRGIGLHIVKLILADTNIFSIRRNIIDNYYVQELRIDLSKLNKKTTK